MEENPGLKKNKSNIVKNIKSTDIFFMIIIMSMIISYFGTRYQKEAWTGESGRLQGVECWLIYFVSYVLISRFQKVSS